MARHTDADGDGIADAAQLTDPDSGAQVGVPDTGDLIDPSAEDPDPDVITDPDHPDYVEPASEATPVDEDDD